MEKVFLLLCKRFYNSNGTEYSQPIGPMDIFIMIDKKTAEEMREICVKHARADRFEVYIRNCDVNGDFIGLKNDSGDRVVYEILEKKIQF